jgi:16S rRNA (uracil1498-N3)-methyltransferase
MEIASPLSFSQLLNAPNFPPTRYLAHPGGPRLRFEETLKEVVIAIGPEGGFSESESQLAQSHGWNLLSLGETILRIETAAVAVASACRFVSYPASGSK